MCSIHFVYWTESTQTPFVLSGVSLDNFATGLGKVNDVSPSIVRRIKPAGISELS